MTRLRDRIWCLAGWFAALAISGALWLVIFEVLPLPVAAVFAGAGLFAVIAFLEWFANGMRCRGRGRR